MVETMKKVLFSGIGAAYLTKEKIEELGRKFISETRMTEAEGRKFVDELVTRSQEARQSMEKMVQNMIDGALSRMNIPTRKDFDELQQRINYLESRVGHKDTP